MTFGVIDDYPTSSDFKLSTPIPRGELMEFFLSRSESWFSERKICETCSVLLCKWSAGLHADVRFPHMEMPVTSMVNSTLLSENRNHPLVQRAVNSHIEPSLTVIIEEMPSARWLLTRGDASYCSDPLCVKQNGETCCTGHARDLLLTHRELMKHSLCFGCLKSFWHWATSGNIDWWKWTHSNPVPQAMFHGYGEAMSPVSCLHFSSST